MMIEENLENTVFAIAPKEMNSNKFMAYNSKSGVLAVLDADSRTLNRYKRTLNEVIGFMKIAGYEPFEVGEVSGCYTVIGFMGELPVYAKIDREKLEKPED